MRVLIQRHIRLYTKLAVSRHQMLTILPLKKCHALSMSTLRTIALCALTQCMPGLPTLMLCMPMSCTPTSCALMLCDLPTGAILVKPVFPGVKRSGGNAPCVSLETYSTARQPTLRILKHYAVCRCRSETRIRDMPRLKKKVPHIFVLLIPLKSFHQFKTAPEQKSKKHPADTSLQEDLSIDATFTPCHCTYCTYCTYCTSIILLCTYRTYCTYYKIICPVCCNCFKILSI
jgi:hypothetical protein